MSMPVCWYRLLWQLGEALFAEVQHLLQKKVTYRYIAAYLPSTTIPGKAYVNGNYFATKDRIRLWIYAHI